MYDVSDTTVFHRTYMGYKANVKIVDTDLLKQVMVKEFDGFVDRTVRTLHVVV